MGYWSGIKVFYGPRLVGFWLNLAAGDTLEHWVTCKVLQYGKGAGSELSTTRCWCSDPERELDKLGFRQLPLRRGVLCRI